MKDSHGTFGSYQELQAAFQSQFTPLEAKRKSQKVKLRALRQWDEGSVIDFNHRFEVVASQCTFAEDEAKDFFLGRSNKNTIKGVITNIIHSLPSIFRFVLVLPETVNFPIVPCLLKLA